MANNNDKDINLTETSKNSSDSEDYLNDSDSEDSISKIVPKSTDKNYDETEEDNIDEDIDNLDELDKDDDKDDDKDIDDSVVDDVLQSDVNEKQSCIYDTTGNSDDEIDFINIDNIENIDNKEILLEGPNRITFPMMTKYEYVRIIGTRAKQIALGSKKFIKNTDNMSPKIVAMLELKNKICPFKIKRPLPGNRYELWSVSELEIPNIE
jgi:DNA-directed RNA polymerase subunit K/omega